MILWAEAPAFPSTDRASHSENLKKKKKKKKKKKNLPFV